MTGNRADLADPDEFCYRIEGPLGEGELYANFVTVNLATEKIAYGMLKLPNGEAYNLNTGEKINGNNVRLAMIRLELEFRQGLAKTVDIMSSLDDVFLSPPEGTSPDTRFQSMMDRMDEALGLELSNTQNLDPDTKAHLQALKELGAFYDSVESGILVRMDSPLTDDGLAHVEGLTHLKYVKIFGPGITDEGLKHLTGLTNLETLLWNAQVSDDGLQHIKGLTNLRDLSIGGTQVTDDGLQHLKGLTKLESLSLGGTQVTDKGVAELKKSATKLRDTILRVPQPSRNGG